MNRLAALAIVASATAGITATAPPSAAAEKPVLSIYVFTRTDPSGLVDADQKRRSDSVRDLRGVLDKGLKKFKPVLVDDAKSADISVEVLASGMTDTGDRTGWSPLTGFMGSGKVVRAPIVRARVSIGEYTTEIAAGEKVHSWKMAASEWQREFREWANDNSERIAALTSEKR